MPWKPDAHGPDVSHYQHLLNVDDIPEYGVASCKIGEGRTYFDPTCNMWLTAFHHRRIPRRGVYYWLRGDSTIDAQFANLTARLRQVGLEQDGRLIRGAFIQLDWERTRRTDGTYVRDLTYQEIEHFLGLCRTRYGDRHITYGSDWVPDFVTWRNRNPAEPVWYANYNLSDKPTGALAECLKYRAAVSQWTSSYKGGGIASGTPGKPETNRGYDMNHVFDWSVLDRICDLDSTPPPTPVPPTPVPVPVPTPEPREDDDMPKYATSADWWFNHKPQEVTWELTRDSVGKLRLLEVPDHEVKSLKVDKAERVVLTNEEILAHGYWGDRPKGEPGECLFVPGPKAGTWTSP